ncbi:MAG: hypothetical protein MPJ50_03155 [Pirellulales bacterium]|nr:hypothetical protein [Pirellulales bacterium]
MRRIGICMTMCLVAGCAYPPPKVDLLYGPQLIPPPSTASATGTPTGGGQQPPDSSYYDQTPTGTGSGGSGGVTPGGAGTGGSGTSSPGNYSPPDGSLDYRGQSRRGNGSAGFQPVSNSSAAGNPGTNSSTTADPFGTSRSSTSRSTTSPPPRTFPDDGRVTPRNVPGSLPGTSGQTTPNASGDRYAPRDVQPGDQAGTAPARFVPPGNTAALTDSKVQPVSYSRQFTAPDRSSSSSRGSYGRDDNYAWLRGQLEYSQSDRRWKLRYIPITGETDEFGGSVILADAAMSDFRDGEFVTVHGQLDNQEIERGGFAPTFHVQQIARVE